MHKLNPKEWAIIKETEALRAIGDRILVLEDEFKSGYECKACGGTGHTDVKCQFCNGTTLFKGQEDGGPCPDCQIGTSDGRKSLGYELCSVCNGKTGTIIVPDSSKRRPLTGVIISAGRLVTEFRIGQRVLYTNYTGTDFDVKGGIKLRVMRQHDVMCEYKQLKQSADIDEGGIRQEIENVGVA
jgi:co-chaperonin GroES (HSP10)